MVRIFLGLAVIALGLLVATLALGLCVGDLNGALYGLRPLNDELQQLRSASPAAPREKINAARERLVAAKVEQFNPVDHRALVHVMCAMVGILVALLVSCVSVTYFVGTAKWCETVAEAYHLDPALSRQCQRLKRRAFPWALVSFALLLAQACLGMMSYVSAGEREMSPWPNYHLLMAYATTALVALAYYMQWQAIAENSRVIELMMVEVRRMRAERGLPVEG